MAEAQRNIWVVTKEEKGEQFCKGKHIKSNDRDCRSEKYIYTPDSKLDDLPEQELPKCQFRVRSLIHATTPQAALMILQGCERRFEAKEKDLNSCKINLLWWGIKPEAKDINVYEEKAEKCGIVRNGKVCSTPPFDNITSRYGNIMFEYSMTDLLEAYSFHFCDRKTPAFRVLGTFAYKQEVMHVVLICRPDQLEDLPGEIQGLPDCTPEKSVIYKDGEEWVWIPDTTIEKWSSYPWYRRWEHATFAFHLPDGRTLDLNAKDGNMKFCEAAHIFRMHVSPDDMQASPDFNKRYTYEEASDVLKTKGIELKR